MNPRNTVFDAKRLIGRQFGDKTVQEDMKVSRAAHLRCMICNDVRLIVLASY